MLSNTSVDTWSIVATYSFPIFGAKASCCNLKGHIGALKDVEYEYNVGMTSIVPAAQGTFKVVRKPCDLSLYTVDVPKIW